jgi:hypothetical protein
LNGPNYNEAKETEGFHLNLKGLERKNHRCPANPPITRRCRAHSSRELNW